MALPTIPSDTFLTSLSQPAPGSSLSSSAVENTAPPSLPAHLLEVLTPLYDLLERVVLRSQSADGDGDGDGDGGVDAGDPPSLAIKDLASEVLRVKHAAAAARAQIRGLPDLARSVPEQLAEFRLLAVQKERAAKMRIELARKAKEIRAGGAAGAKAGEETAETAVKTEEDVEMKDEDAR